MGTTISENKKSIKETKIVSKIITEITKFVRYIKWLYMLYELNTQISICEPWEKVFCNTLLGTCMLILLYASVVYVPASLMLFVKYMRPIDAMNETILMDILPMRTDEL